MAELKHINFDVAKKRSEELKNANKEPSEKVEQAEKKSSSLKTIDFSAVNKRVEEIKAERGKSNKEKLESLFDERKNERIKTEADSFTSDSQGMKYIDPNTETIYYTPFDNYLGFGNGEKKETVQRDENFKKMYSQDGKYPVSRDGKVVRVTADELSEDERNQVSKFYHLPGEQTISANSSEKKGRTVNKFATVPEGKRPWNIYPSDDGLYPVVEGGKITRVPLATLTDEEIKEYTIPTSTVVAHSAGYLGEKLIGGALDAIEDTADFLVSIPMTAVSEIASDFGEDGKKLSGWLDNEIDTLNRSDLINYWNTDGEENYKLVPEGVKNWGWLPENVGRIVPTIVETVVSGGGSLVDDAAKYVDDLSKAGNWFIDATKRVLRSSETHFGMSAAGSSTEAALNKGAAPSVAVKYGAVASAIEVLTEKLFGGFAGTDIGDSLIDFKVASPTIRKILNIATEVVEEDIVAFVDPVLQRVTGVDKDAEWATWTDYKESGLHGMILSLVMNIATAPFNVNTRSRHIKEINKATKVVNEVIASEEYQIPMLSDLATDEEIQKRKEELQPVAVAYNEFVEKNVQNEQRAIAEHQSPDTLEQAARDVVEGRNAQESAGSHTTTVSDNNNTIPSPKQNAKKTALEVAETKAEEAAYEAGKANVPRENVTLETPAQEEAYNRGRIEHIKNMNSDNSAQNNVDNTSKKVNTNNFQYESPTERAERIDTYIESTVASNTFAISEQHAGGRNIATMSSFRHTIHYQKKSNGSITVYVEGERNENNGMFIPNEEVGTYDTVEEAYTAAIKYLANKKGVYETYPKTFHQYNDLYNERHPSEEKFEHNNSDKFVQKSVEKSSETVYNEENADTTSEAEKIEQKMRDIISRFGLSEDEANAVFEYKTAESYKINAKLRDDETQLDEYQKEIVELLDSALKKLPIHRGKVYRTVSFDDLFNPEEEYNAFLEEHIDGAVVLYKAYTSTSSEIDGHPMPENTKYGITLEIEGESGRNVDGFGDNSEKEVVYPRGLRFAVTEVSTDSNGRPYIKVKEIIENDRQQRHSEERSNILQQMQTKKEIHGDLHEISEQHTDRSVDTENTLQGVRGDKGIKQTKKKKHLADSDMLQSDDSDKLAMWTTKRVGDEVKPKSISEIVAYIEHEFGINITTGHIREKEVLGTYTPDNHGIKTKIANNLPVISHELGHYFERTLNIKSQLNGDLIKELKSQLDADFAANYTDEQVIREGVAEYVRRFLQNRETAAIDYPKFNDFFLKLFPSKDLAKLQQLADDVNAYYSLDADTATSSIRLREEGSIDLRTPIEKLKDIGNSLYQAWVDSNHSIKRFDRATGSNAYTFASIAAYSDAMAGQIITGDLTDKNGQYVSSGLKTVLHGIDLNNKEEYKLFGEYLTVKHGPERLQEGMRVFADDRKNSSAWMKNRQTELEAQYPQFQEASERLYEFIRQFYETWGVETGLISQEMLDSWSGRWKYYVPFNRVMEKSKGGFGAKRGFANQNSTVNKARGSGRDIQHPVDNLINNIVKMVNVGTRNNVMAVITDSAEKFGADATFLEKVPMPITATKIDMAGVKDKLTSWLGESDLDSESKDTASGIVNSLDDFLIQYGRGKAFGDVVTVLKNGKPEYWKINDAGLLESLTSLSPKTMDGILDAYAVASRFMTSNITGNNLVWSIFSNLPRDFGTFFTYSKNKNIVKMAKGVGSAYFNKAKGDNADPLYKEFLAMGGGKTSAYTADRNLAKNARKKLSGKKFDPNPLSWIGFVSDTVESGPRFATYKLMREAGMTPQEAFYEAMDITVNFRKGGRVSRELNKVVPFFNANIQGLDKFFRWITADEFTGTQRKKAIVGRLSAYFAVSAALAAISYAINNGDEEKEEDYEQLSTYTKNSFWVFPIGDGKYFAIPKPREIGVLSSFFETCMEYGIGKNDHAFDEFYSYATENCLPAIANDIAQLPKNGFVETGMGIIGSFGMIGVVGYLGANRDFLGRPIVASGLQNLEKKDQYTDRTSKIAYLLGQATGGSPEQIDYFFQQTLGGWWKGQKALFPVGEKNKDFTLGVANTYIKDNQYSTDLTSWLYDCADATARAKNSDPNNIEKSISAKWDSNMTDFYGKYYKKAKNNSDSTSARSTRQLVLDMIREYQKGIDGNYKTSLQKQVEAVCEEKGNTEYMPSVMPSEVTDGNDVKHNLSDVQYVEYQTDYLRLYWEIVEDSLTNSMTTEEKARILKAAKQVAKEQATEHTLNRIGAPSSKFAIKYEGVANDDLTEFLASVSAAGDDDSVKKAEVVDVIYGMDIDSDDAWTLYLSKYDSYSANYARDKGINGKTYMNFLESLDEVDRPTESGVYGTYTQEEAYNAIKNLRGLSQEERAILWQSVNKNWKAKNNPFR